MSEGNSLKSKLTTFTVHVSNSRGFFFF
uniref:Uncharacterized protein n=1 Tax=Rhizophora mucronata TaxID=61149 RepID=A0A2P2QUC7_RHIMU